MNGLANKLMNMDRRIIYALIILTVIVPLLHGPFNLPIRVTQEVRRVYDTIESLPPGSVFLISMDFDPASKPELYPMSVALIRHAFMKNLRVIGMNLWYTGIGMSEQLMYNTAKEFNKKYGEDYVYLGWMPGDLNVILGMGQDLYRTFPKDYYGNDTRPMTVLKGVRSLRDVDYMMDVAAGDPGIEIWYIYGREKYGFEMGGGCTAVIAPGMYPYYQAKQINGLLGGMRGAAEYETLVQRGGKATIGMDAQSMSHMLIIILVITSNVVYFMTRRGEGATR